MSTVAFDEVELTVPEWLSCSPDALRPGATCAPKRALLVLFANAACDCCSGRRRPVSGCAEASNALASTPASARCERATATADDEPNSPVGQAFGWTLMIAIVLLVVALAICATGTFGTTSNMQYTHAYTLINCTVINKYFVLHCSIVYCTNKFVVRGRDFRSRDGVGRGGLEEILGGFGVSGARADWRRDCGQ